MQNTIDLALPEQEMLEQILADLEVRGSEELVVMKAEGDRLIDEAFAQKIPLAILHRRVGNRERLEDFLRHAQSIRQIPAVNHSWLQSKISEDFVGELELHVTSHDAEAAFRNAISAASPFFGEVTATEEDGCLVLRVTADLFELVAFTEPFDTSR